MCACRICRIAHIVLCAVSPSYPMPIPSTFGLRGNDPTEGQCAKIVFLCISVLLYSCPVVFYSSPFAAELVHSTQHNKNVTLRENL